MIKVIALSFLFACLLSYGASAQPACPVNQAATELCKCYFGLTFKVCAAPRRVSAQEEVEVQLRRNENVQRCDAWAVGGLYAPYAANHDIGWPYCVGSHASVGSSFQRDGLRAEGSLSLSRSSKIPS